MFKKISIFIFAFLAIPASVFAEKLPIDPITPGITSIPQFIKSLLDIVVKIGIPISAIFLIWAGFLFVTAQGDPGKLTTAKKAFVWAVIGTAVVLGAWLLSIAIQTTIWERVGGNPPPPSVR
jgi:hypothetical protein